MPFFLEKFYFSYLKKHIVSCKIILYSIDKGSVFMRDFETKIALVTGSSKGIGTATIRAFAKEGCNVIIHYNTHKEEAIRLKEEVEKNDHVKAICIHADLRCEEEIKQMVQQAMDTFGRIDILVNNAGIAIDSLLEDKTKENFMNILEVNLIGAFLLSKEVGRYMMEQKSGTIINISSTNGIDTPYPESIDYDASKAGLISITKNLSTIYAPYIRVNCIASGWVETDMNQDMDASFKEQELSKILLKRFALPEEIANVCVFLASDKASYMNGSVIRVDGGVK